MDKREIVVFSRTGLHNHLSFYQMLQLFAEHASCALSFILPPWFVGKLQHTTSIRGRSLLRLARNINKHDLVIFEPDGPLLALGLLVLLSKPKLIMVVHNANRWLLPPQKSKIRNRLKYLVKQRIIRKCDAFITIDSGVAEYIRILNSHQKPVFMIPFANYLEKVPISAATKDTGSITITVPGIVENKRRDYDLALDVFEELMTKGTKTRMILLGRVKEEERVFLSRLNRLRNKYPENLLVFDKYIDEETYTQLLQSSDFFIGNLKLDYEHSFSNERYGESKASGIVFLMIKYLTKTFLPAPYPIRSLWQGLVIKYSSKEELVAKLQKSSPETNEIDVELLKNQLQDEITHEFDRLSTFLHP